MITIISPQAGAIWTRGQAYDIRWSSDQIGTGSVTIELWKNGTFVKQLTGTASNDGAWTWYPSEDNKDIGTGFQIAVRHNSGGISGKSGTITINPPPIVVTFPAGSEVLERGKSYEIKWTNKIIGGSVKIVLMQGSSLYDVLTSATLNDGSWTYEPNPESSNVGTGFQIRIINPDGLWGTSNKFTIKAATDPILLPPVCSFTVSGGV